jgi:orotidine-5'-phosphate decarboxylase
VTDALQRAASDRLIVALDTPTVAEARALVDRLQGRVSFFKVGLELVMRGGLPFVEELVGEGHRVFLDMKLLDIEATVERAVANAAQSGATFLTIHGTDLKTMRAAAAGARGSGLGILAVTVLTNLSGADLAEQGISGYTPAELVVHRARLAMEAGCDGIIASGQETAAVRAATAPGFAIVTPGIRLPTDEAGDQTRITTPQSAISAGADYLVVGRPITRAGDVAAAADTFIAAISQA